MICQLTENLLPGDAVGDHVRALDAALKSAGYDTAVAVGAGGGTMSVHDLPKLGQGDLLLYEYSIGSALNDWFAEQRCPRAAVYQNITPAEFFSPWAPSLADKARLGREQLYRIAPGLSFGIAASEYSARELRDCGCGDVTVLPILLSRGRYAVEPDPALLRTLSDGKVNILFVGRKAPNKRIEDVLLAADYYAAATGTDCRAVLVGDDSMTSYCARLRELISTLSIEVLWLGRVDQAKLNAAYRGSRLFLCMSEHEGFCVPMTECMLFDLPVLAYSAAAVPETLGGSGLLFTRKSLPELCEAIHALLFDEELRAAVIEGQRQRLETLSPERTARRWIDTLCSHGFTPTEKGSKI